MCPWGPWQTWIRSRRKRHEEEKTVLQDSEAGAAEQRQKWWAFLYPKARAFRPRRNALVKGIHN